MTTDPKAASGKKVWRAACCLNAEVLHFCSHLSSAMSKKQSINPQEVLSVGSSRVSVVRKLAEGLIVRCFSTCVHLAPAGGFGAVFLAADAGGLQYALKKVIFFDSFSVVLSTKSQDVCARRDGRCEPCADRDFHYGICKNN